MLYLDYYKQNKVQRQKRLLKVNDKASRSKDLSEGSYICTTTMKLTIRLNKSGFGWTQSMPGCPSRLDLFTFLEQASAGLSWLSFLKLFCSSWDEAIVHLRLRQHICAIRTSCLEQNEQLFESTEGINITYKERFFSRYFLAVCWRLMIWEILPLQIVCLTTLKQWGHRLTGAPRPRLANDARN